MFAATTTVAVEVGITGLMMSILTAALLALAFIVADRLLDAFRKKGVLLHVRDRTLARLADQCNNGAQIAGRFGRMYFTVYNPVYIIDIQGIANIVAHNSVVYAAIRAGFWDAKTQVGINAFIVNCPSATSAIARDPSLGTPSRKAVLILSAARGSFFASFFGGGIDVEYSAMPGIPRTFDKSVVTCYGERVERGKYIKVPLP